MIETMIVGSLLGREVISKSVSEITSKTYNNIYNLLNNNEFIFKDLLEEMDITVKIQVIDKMITELDSKKGLSESIHICLINLHNIIEKINNEIIEIEKSINDFDKIWFKFLYTNPSLKLISNLRKHTKIMDERLDILVKLLFVA